MGGADVPAFEHGVFLQCSALRPHVYSRYYEQQGGQTTSLGAWRLSPVLRTLALYTGAYITDTRTRPGRADHLPLAVDQSHSEPVQVGLYYTTVEYKGEQTHQPLSMASSQVLRHFPLAIPVYTRRSKGYVYAPHVSSSVARTDFQPRSQIHPAFRTM